MEMQNVSESIFTTVINIVLFNTVSWAPAVHQVCAKPFTSMDSS